MKKKKTQNYAYSKEREKKISLDYLFSPLRIQINYIYFGFSFGLMVVNNHSTNVTTPSGLISEQILKNATIKK